MIVTEGSVIVGFDSTNLLYIRNYHPCNRNQNGAIVALRSERLGCAVAARLCQIALSLIRHFH